MRAALQHADCLLATYEQCSVTGFPFGEFYCMLEYARCPLNWPGDRAMAALQAAPCPRRVLQDVRAVLSCTPPVHLTAEQVAAGRA